MKTAFVGMGSNMDNPIGQLQSGLYSITQLEQSELIQCSKLYQSRAIGPKQDDYINAVIEIHTSLTPIALLEALQAIEHRHGRKRDIHWGPRTLDLDILLFGSDSICSEQLTVPHKELSKRNFVLYPLAEIAPDLILPNHVALSTLVANCPAEGIERVDPLVACLEQNNLLKNAQPLCVKRAINA